MKAEEKGFPSGEDTLLCRHCPAQGHQGEDDSEDIMPVF